MKKILLALAFIGCMFAAHAQEKPSTGDLYDGLTRPLTFNRVIPPYALEVTFSKTVHVIFPSAIRYVDLGSSDLLAAKADGTENVLRVKAALRDFSRESNLSVITEDGAYYSFNALMDRDPQCSRYIDIYGSETGGLGQTLSRTKDTGKGKEGDSLGILIEKGLKEAAAETVAALLEEKDALDIINGEMIPALDRVGKGFEKGSVFLPQLLMSAEAAKAAFEVIKAKMEGSGQGQEKKGTIILATVKGDIHDIGKNIVKVLLENYSYEVIDLGKDVPPERIVEEAVKRHVPLVGLSALMTTTVPSMEETIRRLRKEASWVKVMVGGAVLTKEYADTIGADAYCRDAMASVHYAETVIG